jgi:ketosteroid isomerase-like protein
MSEQTGTEPPREVDESRDDTNVQPFLDRYARALAAGDAATVASMWETPALVVADQTVRAVAAGSEVEAFFRGAIGQYTERGITGTRADIVWLDQATDRIVVAQVRWPHLDKDGKEIGEEVSTYTLRRSDSGDLRIRAVVMHGTPGTH